MGGRDLLTPWSVTAPTVRPVRSVLVRGRHERWSPPRPVFVGRTVPIRPPCTSGDVLSNRVRKSFPGRPVKGTYLPEEDQDVDEMRPDRGGHRRGATAGRDADDQAKLVVTAGPPWRLVVCSGTAAAGPTLPGRRADEDHPRYGRTRCRSFRRRPCPSPARRAVETNEAGEAAGTTPPAPRPHAPIDAPELSRAEMGTSPWFPLDRKHFCA